MTVIRGAMMSPCGTYRYWLMRRWDESRPDCAFIMLNPSTADAERDDPTIRRVMGFAQSWGFGGVNIYNLFALRTPYPRELLAHPDPVGPDNDAYLAQIPDTALVVAAWGAHGNYRGRAFTVRRMFGARLRCLGRTKQGEPRHPLYVASSVPHEPLIRGPIDKSLATTPPGAGEEVI
jgi:hypothetical protein